MDRAVIAKLIRLHLLTPGGICTLTDCLAREGMTLMALLRFAAHYYPEHCALVSEEKRLTYKEMYHQAHRLATLLRTTYSIEAGMHVGLLCRNHPMLTLLLPALSRLGAKIKLFNTDIPPRTINETAKQNAIDLLIVDEERQGTLLTDGLSCTILTGEGLSLALSDYSPATEAVLPRIRRGREIAVFTGGSSGHYKEAPRQMSLFQFLPPFFALLRDIRIDERESVFLPLPVYHGFGLATLIVSILMGKKVCLTKKFDSEQALQMIAREKIDVLSLVPAMLARLWQTDCASSLMASVKCIICGGDRLDRKWIKTTHQLLGPVVYNLYGTSEAGFFMLATPHDLMANEEVTIGRPIKGVRCRIEQPASNGVGSLWVQSRWAMRGMKNKWQDTGDLVCRHADGLYFYRGRADKMVVCGGENVYPEHVERIINEHPEVVKSLVFPVPDERYGMVLHAKLELTAASTLSPEDLISWLRPRLSRFELPHQIVIQPISVLETGKVKRQ